MDRENQKKSAEKERDQKKKEVDSASKSRNLLDMFSKPECAPSEIIAGLSAVKLEDDQLAAESTELVQIREQEQVLLPERHLAVVAVPLEEERYTSSSINYFKKLYVQIKNVCCLLLN